MGILQVGSEENEIYYTMLDILSIETNAYKCLVKIFCVFQRKTGLKY